MIGLYSLSFIQGNDVSILDSTAQSISISYKFGILAFLSLIPFVWFILELIKPSTIIGKLSQDITKNSIKEYSKDLHSRARGSYKKHKNPIQPIIDIIKSSLYKSDLVTFL